MLNVTCSEGVLAIELDRPRARNALSPELLSRLSAALDDGMAPEVRVVTLRGVGPSFCAGADFEQALSLQDEPAREFLGALARVLAQIRALPKPVVVGVHGHAAGGGAEIMVEADLRIVASDAEVWLPDVTIGSTPATLWRLTRMVGSSVATEMAMLGRTLRAPDLVRLQLVHGDPVDAVDLSEQLSRVAGELCEHGPALSMALAKAAVHLAEEAPRLVDLESNVQAMLACQGTDAQLAALEKFKGRRS
jgi:enoyl-CoA hydratase/carnithine racemase